MQLGSSPLFKKKEKINDIQKSCFSGTKLDLVNAESDLLIESSVVPS